MPEEKQKEGASKKQSSGGLSKRERGKVGGRTKERKATSKEIPLKERGVGLGSSSSGGGDLWVPRNLFATGETEARGDL